jgi:KaiC/GvpD/RAD55 family RecA-like ATPase
MEDQGIGGRVVLVIGPFGSGKSLLSLQMAVEVARKGGVAWVMALEQTPEECEYSMEAIGVSLTHPAMQTYRHMSEAMQALAMPVGSKGALVFLRPEPSDKPDFGGFLERVQSQLAWMERYPLRLLVIDPVNALGQASAETDPRIRSKTRAMFEAAKHQNVNVWFASEQQPDQSSQDRFEENVADTVIHLGVDTRYGQPRRYIEITKSRFQHEYSGRHALAIEPRTGMHVYPPAAIIARSVRSEPATKGSPTYQFGVAGMGQLFGPAGLMPGDIIVFEGPGKAKTLLGVQFWTASLEDSGARNVFVSDYSLQRISQFVESTMRLGGLESTGQSNIVHCSIQDDLADPSRVLLHIRKALEKCLEDGYSPGRVLVTNLARWEKEMPALGADTSFGIALSRLLRSYGVVSVVINGDELEGHGSPLRETMASQADALIHFHRQEFKGRVTTLLTTIKSRLMRHPRESFELLVEENQLRIGPAPLFRVNAAGDVTPVRVVLYLHAETPNHQRYNEKILAALQTTLSPNTAIAPQILRYDPQLLSMSQYSAVDELQVFQLDEFQLPAAGSINDARVLHAFESAAHPNVLEGRLPSLTSRVTCDGDKRFFAVPFYQNISFLAYRPDLYQNEFQTPLPENWDDLVERCKAWEARHPSTGRQIAASLAGPSTKRRTTHGEYPVGTQPGAPSSPPEVFFSCAVFEEGVETYNCFFMELLYAIAPPSDGHRCDLAAWLWPDERTMKAALQFRALCRRSHLVGFRSERRPRAIYWRHWYNTLNQELSSMLPEERSQVEVRPLFNGVTTAGDWYLAIPAQSASPEIGLDLIDNLTSPEREMQRLQLGVGLPTRESFYAPLDARLDPLVSPYFRFSRPELRTLVDKAIRRSRFHCYERFSGTISAHLQSILEIPDGSKMEGEIRSVLTSLVSNIDFLRESVHCGGCRRPPLIPALVVPGTPR